MSTTKKRPPPTEIAVAIMLAIAAALSAVLGLSALARPSRFEMRLAAIRSDSAEAKILLERRPNRIAPRSADCAAPASAVGEKLRRDLATLAGNAHLDPPRIDVQPAVVTAADGGLEPYDVRFEATGPYDAALGVLAAVPMVRPTIFIDTADLQAKVSAVTLSFKGRVYCAPRH